MNEKEQNELEKLNDNPTLLEAIKEVLFSKFDLNEVVKNMKEDVDNQILGEITRSCIGGAELLKEGFKKIESYKKVEDKLDETNIAI